MISVSANDSRDRTNLSLFKLIKINDRQLFEAISCRRSDAFLFIRKISNEIETLPPECDEPAVGRPTEECRFATLLLITVKNELAHPLSCQPNNLPSRQSVSIRLIRSKRQSWLVGSKLPTARYR